ncbi:hypothetical protein F383_37274 [Gossypium arboreum]|uniref:Uncharacterized protein n=1 Tax=Gossypium arboreum TaxID=29729 RepID=A0A0B0MGJ4_GOSAR|nr:hypothetical protein F383_37274 [Gossypium arboreum]
MARKASSFKKKKKIA